MAIKSTKKGHILKAEHLKNLRLSAGFEQEELAQRIKIPRGKISRIENCHLDEMNNLKDDQVERWYKACSPYLDEETRKGWFDFILSLFGYKK